MKIKEYYKYRWFYTSAGTLVIGGKNARQNDELLSKMLSMKKKYYVMHTSHPGSPFSVIIKDIKKVKEEEIEECAIFTGCFSRAWREQRKKTRVDIFTTPQISKTSDMKDGMWRVAGKIKKTDVELKLALVKQKGVLRAVPIGKVKKKNTLIKIYPGSVDKEQMAVKFGVALGDKFTHVELMAALPAGGVKIYT